VQAAPAVIEDEVEGQQLPVAQSVVDMESAPSLLAQQLPEDVVMEDTGAVKSKWMIQKEDSREKILKRAEAYGLRLLTDEDHLPETLKKRISTFGTLVLIRPGTHKCKPDDPLREFLEFSLGIDPNMGTFLVCACPFTGDEFWIGFGMGDRIGYLLDLISAIESQIGDDVNELPVVKLQEKVFNDLVDLHVSALDKSSSQKAFLGSQKAKTALLVLKAAEAKKLRVGRQGELDDIRSHIARIQTKLHNISCEFLTAWSLLTIPRFDLKNIVKCGGKGELGDKQKAILTQLAHCKLLTRLRIAAAKCHCDITEVTESGSSKDCSYCNSKNSPRTNRFYHCRNCKTKMTRDGNAAMNIFTKALATVIMRMNLRDPYPDGDFDVDEDDDGSDSDVESEGELQILNDLLESMEGIVDVDSGERDGEDMSEDEEQDEMVIDQIKEPDKEEEERAGVGGVMGAGGSRVVGSGYMEDHGLLQGSNVLPKQLRSRASRTPAVESQTDEQGSQSIRHFS